MLIRRLQFMKEDYKEDLTIYQQQLSQVLQSLAPSFQNPRYTHARDPNERNKKLLKKVSQVISGYLTRFGKSYVHLVFLLQKFFSMGAPTNSGARGPPTAKSGPADRNMFARGKDHLQEFRHHNGQRAYIQNGAYWCLQHCLGQTV